MRYSELANKKTYFDMQLLQVVNTFFLLQKAVSNGHVTQQTPKATKQSKKEPTAVKAKVHSSIEHFLKIFFMLC